MKATRCILALMLVLSFVGSGCQPKAVDSSQAETTATASLEPDPSAVNEGLPIQDIGDKVVAGDSPDRVALLTAAHSATGITEDFYVWQLYVQGSSAVGDLQGSTSGNRLLVSFENDGSGWKAAYQKKFIDASEAELLTSSPLVTDELAQRVDFVVPVAIDDFYLSKRARLIANAREMGETTAMYAPTRLPEGYTPNSETIDYDYLVEDSVFKVEYRSGSSRLVYYPWLYGDYGEEWPDATFGNLRFGDQVAIMDSSFYFYDGYTTEGQGPHLLTGFQAVCGLEISPGMVAAVAESMVKLDDATIAGMLKPPLTTEPTADELQGLSDANETVLWKGQDPDGTWWVATRFTDAIPDTYYQLWVRDAAGAWHSTIPVQSGIEYDGFAFKVPPQITTAMKAAGIIVYNAE